MTKRDLLVAIAALVLGAALWLGWTVWFGDREAWDHGNYIVVMPIVAFVAGAVFSCSRPGLGAVFALAFVTGHVFTGLASMGVGNLWPLTVLFLGLFSSPALVGAGVVYLVSRLRTRAGKDAET